VITTSYPTTSQVGVAARLNQVAMIFSEDFDSNATLDGARFIDQLASEFVRENCGTFMVWQPRKYRQVATF
jgi:hypothetical protein